MKHSKQVRSSATLASLHTEPCHKWQGSISACYCLKCLWEEPLNSIDHRHVTDVIAYVDTCARLLYNLADSRNLVYQSDAVATINFSPQLVMATIDNNSITL